MYRSEGPVVDLDRPTPAGPGPTTHICSSRPTTRRGAMADKSPRQHQSKKSGKSLKEKRRDKKVKQATKRATT
jgi:hypothetical protein